MNPPEDMEIDHIDGNKLNYRKSNLRVVTHQFNSFTRKQSTGKSGTRGVFKKGKRYTASIGVKGKRIWLGRYSTSEKAVKAYEEACYKYFGELPLI